MLLITCWLPLAIFYHTSEQRVWVYESGWQIQNWTKLSSSDSLHFLMMKKSGGDRRVIYLAILLLMYQKLEVLTTKGECIWIGLNLYRPFAKLASQSIELPDLDNMYPSPIYWRSRTNDTKILLTQLVACSQLHLDWNKLSRYDVVYVSTPYFWRRHG